MTQLPFESPLIPLLTHAIQLKVSDVIIHEGKVPFVRLHGDIHALNRHPPITRQQIESFLEHAVLPSQYEQFRQSGDLDLGYTLTATEDDQDLKNHRFRLNVSRTQGRLNIVARPVVSGAFDFSDLGLPPSIQSWVTHRSGLILVVGATGSGKSSTLSALIHYLNQNRKGHIVTIEDPIEFVHQDLNSCVLQREVGTDTVSFHEGLKRVLRQTPDVIMIGEMRDQESIEVALSAAMTGHLVLSTLHTMNSLQTLQRILSYFPAERHQALLSDLALSLRGIFAQRLIPHIDGKGRSLAYECLTNTPAVAQLIREYNEIALEDLMRQSRTDEISTFNQSLHKLVLNHKISPSIALAYSHHREELTLRFQGMGTQGASHQIHSSGEDELTLEPKGSTPLPDLHQLLQRTLHHKASDLHLAVNRPPIIRKMGTLLPLIKNRLSATDIRTLLYSVMSTRQRSSYELNKELDFSIGLQNGQRFRVNAYFQKGNMAASLRSIPSEIPDPNVIYIPTDLLNLCQNPHGLILVVGPTGSGKSTTLACMINQINQNQRKRIITIEDPIEFTHRSIQSTIDQREVYEDTLSIASALKSVLRQDPDVILVGEMRDQETISAALTAAETGHLVFATLHTNDAAQTIDRIIDAFPAYQQPQIRSQISASLVAIISQRLLPHAYENTRVPIFETLVGTPAVRTLIRDNKMHQALGMMEVSANEGMMTFDRALSLAYEKGLIERDEALRYMKNPKNLSSPTLPLQVSSSRKDPSLL